MSGISIDQAFDLAVVHHQSGRLHEALAIYRQIVALNPKHADALHLLGVAELQIGRTSEALSFIRRAIEIEPSAPAYHCNLGQALEANGAIEEAIAEYRAAIKLMPRYAEAHSNMGNALLHKGLVDDAVASYQQALEARPGYTGALYNLGVAQLARGDIRAAIDAFVPVVAAQPENLDARSNLGNALLAAGRVREAVGMLKAVVLARPTSADAHYNLGAALLRDNQFEQAIASLRQSLQPGPASPEALSNIGSALHELRRLDESIAAYRAALQAAPNDPQIHTNLGLTLLLKGDFEHGWPEHEWRWRTHQLTPLRREFGRPQWDGSDLQAKRILLYTEQGFGDAIQFVRYVQSLKQRGADVILECQPELAPLFRGIAHIDQLIVRGDPLPEFEAHCPLMSLPGILGVSADNVLVSAPYLAIERGKLQPWHDRFGSWANDLKVGIVWAGQAEHRNDRNRSVPLQMLMSHLGAVDSVRFISLQKGPAEMELERLTVDPKPIAYSKDLRDFADTAALVSALDLVITVDTAVAHLSGALGKPTWLLLPFVPDWRWLLDRQDSPWYPSMQLFRQQAPGDWLMPMFRVAEALRNLGSGA